MPRYYTVKLCIALQNPGFIGFLAEGLEKPNFDVIFFSKWNNKSLIRWLNIQDTRTFCSLLLFFLAPLGLGKILRNSQNIRAYYMLNHRIRCMYCRANSLRNLNISDYTRDAKNVHCMHSNKRSHSS